MTSKTTMVLEINELKAKLKAKDEEIKELKERIEDLEVSIQEIIKDAIKQNKIKQRIKKYK